MKAIHRIFPAVLAALLCVGVLTAPTGEAKAKSHAAVSKNVIVLTEPAPDRIVTEGQRVTITASVRSGQKIAKVVFYECPVPDGKPVKVGEVKTAPYTASFTPACTDSGNGYGKSYVYAVAVTAENREILSAYTRVYIFPAGAAKPSFSAEVCKWKDGRKCAYTPTNDDNYFFPSHVVSGRLYANYGIKSTLFWDTEHNTRWKSLKQKILDKGFTSLQSHTVRHKHFTKLSAAAIRREMADSRREIDRHTNGHALTLAYPFYDMNNKVADIAKKYYIAARWGSNGGNRLDGSLTNPKDPAVGINRYNTTDYYRIKAMCPAANTSAAVFNKWLDEAVADGGWLVVSMHGLSGVAEPGSWKTQDAAQLRKHLAYARDKIRDGSVWNDTFENVARYLRERNACTIVREKTTDVLELRFKVALHNTGLAKGLLKWLDVPLTIRVNVPAGWASATVTQDGIKKTVRVTQAGGQACALFDVRPQGGEIVLAEGN